MSWLTRLRNWFTPIEVYAPIRRPQFNGCPVLEARREAAKDALPQDSIKPDRSPEFERRQCLARETLRMARRG